MAPEDQETTTVVPITFHCPRCGSDIVRDKAYYHKMCPRCSFFLADKLFENWFKIIPSVSRPERSDV